MKKQIESVASLPRRHRFASSNVSATVDEASEIASAARELLRAGLRARREAAAFGGGREADASSSIDSLATSLTSSSSTSSTSTKSQLAAALVAAHARSKASPGGEERFLSVLCSDFGVDRRELERAVEAWRTSVSSSSSSSSSFSDASAAAAEERLRRASTPSYESFWPVVAGVPKGLATLAELRAAALSQREEEGGGGELSSPSPSPRRRAALASSLARSLAPALASGTCLIRLVPPKEGQKQNRQEREQLSLLSLAASDAQRSLHPVRSARDWEARLTPPRACFALLHERGFGREVPLATVACFSGERVAARVSEVLPRIGKEEEEERFSSSSSSCSLSSSSPPAASKTDGGGPSATLYALCSAHAGISGLEVARAAARGAAEALARGGGGSGGSGSGNGDSNLPPATRIATLSPLPGFLPWLRAMGREGNGGAGSSARKLEFRREEVEATQGAAAAAKGGRRGGASGDGEKPLSLLLSTLEDGNDGGDGSDDRPFPSELLRPVLLRLATRFVALETVRRLPLDPVARFHAANGAALARLCWRAVDSLESPRKTRGVLSESAGIMVNYSYLWPRGEEPLRPEGGGAGGMLRVSEGVARLLEAGGGETEPERWGLVD